MNKQAQVSFRDGESTRWRASIFAAGVEVKDLGAANGRAMQLVRFPPGTAFPAHKHEGPEFVYVLEGELVLVIGKAGRHIKESDALDHIAAVTLCNEGTIRDWVRHAKFNVTQGKNFDSTGSLGPWLVPYASESQIADIRLTTRVNGETRQDDRTGRLIFGFRYLINYLSTFTTLVPGDVIVTGTPTGAGARFDPPRYLNPGDVIEVEADGVGVLKNGVIDEA